ncbi:hypothetical protein KC330_g8999 [Hortaea werneckii]|nr:hypothetical protein KC330_g8999 [Hortaea werneckii]
MVRINPNQQDAILAGRSKAPLSDEFTGGKDVRKKWFQWLCTLELSLHEHSFKDNTTAILFIVLRSQYLKDDAYRQLSPRLPTYINRSANMNCYQTVTQLLKDMQNQWQRRAVAKTEAVPFTEARPPSTDATRFVP